VLVVVISVLGVTVSVVNKVHVVVVFDRLASALSTVSVIIDSVLGDRVFRVNFSGAHGVPFDG